MLNIFHKIYDSLFPLHPSLARIKDETPEKFLRFYNPQTISNFVTLSDFNITVVRATVTANKFHDSKTASLLLASLLEQWLVSLPNKNTILVPIPLSSTRHKERGYNQVTRILEAATTGEMSIVNLLSRTKHTAPQTSLPRKERFKNVANAFTYQSLTNLPKTKIERVIIVDDVITTGATIEAAKATLRPHLPKNCQIICLALAH